MFSTRRIHRLKTSLVVVAASMSSALYTSSDAQLPITAAQERSTLATRGSDVTHAGAAGRASVAAIRTRGECDPEPKAAASTCVNRGGNHSFLSNCCICDPKFDCFYCPGGTYQGCQSHGTVSGTCLSHDAFCDDTQMPQSEVEALLSLADAKTIVSVVKSLGQRAGNITFNFDRQAIQVMGCRGEVRYHMPVSARQASVLRYGLVATASYRAPQAVADSPN
jgi:hypothetical protein